VRLYQASFEPFLDRKEKEINVMDPSFPHGISLFFVNRVLLKLSPCRNLLLYSWRSSLNG